MKRFKKFFAVLAIFGFVALTACGLKGPMIPKSNIPADIDADVKKEIERLYSSSAMERRSGANILGNIGKRAAPAVPFLIDMLKDKDIFVRTNVATALGKIGGPSAIAPLISAIKDEEKGVKGQAVMGYVIEGVAVLTGSIPNNYRLGSVTKTATDALTNIKRRDRGELWSVAWAIADIGKPAVEPLIAALKNKDSDEAIKRRVPVALGRIGDSRAIEPLIAVLKDKDEDVRLSAVLALGKIGGPSSAGALTTVLNDKNNDVRLTAVVALGNSKDPRAVEPLIAVLSKDEQDDVRKEAAWALGKIGGADAADALFAALKDKDNGVRWIATVALANNKDPRAVEPLISALKDKNYRVRLSAAEVIIKIDDPRAIEPLTAALKELPELLKNEHWTLRKNVVDRLSSIGRPAVEALIAFLTYEDQDNEVRLSAAVALGNIKDSRAVEPLIAILKGKPQMAWIDDKQVKIRLDIRGTAATALGNIKNSRAAEPLIAALKDKDDNVRKSAALALRKITGKDFGQDHAKWQEWWAENRGSQPLTTLK